MISPLEDFHSTINSKHAFNFGKSYHRFMIENIADGTPIYEFHAGGRRYPMLSVSYDVSTSAGYTDGLGIVFHDDEVTEKFFNDPEVASIRKISPFQTIEDSKYMAIHHDGKVIEDPLGALEYGPYEDSALVDLNTDLKNLVVRFAARNKIPYATLVFHEEDGFELEVGCSGDRNGSIIYGWGDNIITGGWFRRAWNEWRKENGWTSTRDVGLIGNTPRATSDANAYPIDLLNDGMLTDGILYIEEHRPVLMVSSPGDYDSGAPDTRSELPDTATYSGDDGDKTEVDESIQKSVDSLGLPE